MEQCIEAMLEDEQGGGGNAQPWSTGDDESCLSNAVQSLRVSEDLAKGVSTFCFMANP